MGLVRSVSELNLQKRCQCLSEKPAEKITDDDSSSHSDTEPLPIESNICSDFTTLAGGGKCFDSGLPHFYIWCCRNFLVEQCLTFIKNSSPCIPQLHLPEDKITEIVSELTLEINRGLAILRAIASRRDLKKFLYVTAGLWFLSIMGKRWNLLTLLCIAIVLLFTIPIVYDTYGDKIDPLPEKATIELKKLILQVFKKAEKAECD